MNAVTQCPTCSTRFRVSQQQLDAYHGMVRCGRCQAVFNAAEYLHEEEPSPQLDLPIMLEEVAPEESVAPAESNDTTANEPAALAEEELPEQHAEALQQPEATPQAEAPPHSEEVPEQLPPETFPEPVAEQPVEPPASEDEEFLAARPKKKGPWWPWALAGFVLLLILLGQAAYFFRIGLAARLPGLKPALVGYCSLLDCQVPLPRDPDLMSIDASDLEASSDHANVIILTATLRNNARYAQAYPDLELTLNDTSGKPVARRIFHPVDYLRQGKDENSGLAGSRTLDITLNLDTADLKPSGYRLLLYYP